MNLFFASRRLNYFLRARHRKGHGIHSPFVFNLFSDFFLNKPDPMVVKTVVDLLYQLQHDQVAEKYNIYYDRSLKSDHFSEKKRVEVRGLSGWDRYSRLLALLAGRACTLPVLQIGGGLRMATLALAAGASGSGVIVIEEREDSERYASGKKPEIMNEVKPENLPGVDSAAEADSVRSAEQKPEQERVNAAEAESVRSAEQKPEQERVNAAEAESVRSAEQGKEIAICEKDGIILPGNIEMRLVDSFESQGNTGFEEGSAGLILIDANSCRHKLLYCFEMVTGVVSEETIVVIENIHFSADTETGWKRLISDRRVSVSIDLLRYGLLFFRKGISKQHFLIRY